MIKINKKVFYTIFLLLISQNLVAENCNGYLKEADKNIRKMEDTKWTDKVTALSNKATTYLLRYEICVKRKQKKNTKN